jgi:TonB family protein
MPSFPGGLSALGKYLHENLKYPSKELFFSGKENLAGLAKVAFIVQADGSIDHVRIAESSNDIFNQAAMDVIKNMPDWKPGSQRGKKVPCKVIVPVEFKLPQE